MSEHEQIRALVTRLFDAIERGDVAEVDACYAPNLVIWHNFDDLEQSRADNLKTLAGLIERISDRRYESRRLHVFDGGFVQQHVLSGVRKDGLRVSAPAAMIGAVRNGQVSRLDEYLDSAHVAVLRAKVEPAS
jgi:ketosteroid isomerase-like protein